VDSGEKKWYNKNMKIPIVDENDNIIEYKK